MTTETLYVIHLQSGLEIGIGTIEQIEGLCDGGVLPPFDTLELEYAGTFAVSA